MANRQHHNKKQWQSLIKEQQASGLSAAEFCRQNQLNAKYFSKRKSDYPLALQEKKPCQFVQLKRPQSKTETPQISPQLLLKHKDSQLYIPDTFDIQWLAALLKALA